jgi:site-specific recombinase XerD
MSTLRQQMIQDLQLGGLSERTQEAYVRAVRQLADHFHRPPDQLSEQQVRDYFLFLKNKKKFAPSSLKIAFSGIKFFYTRTVPRDWPTLAKLRVPRRKTLPDVLTIEEVRKLIEAVRTPHNKAHLWTVYSLGLRLTEGLHLQIGDIDSARMLVHVHRGKGAKDRYVPLPPKTLATLREYWATHRNPLWLFPATGRDQKKAATATEPMAKASVQGALRRVVVELGFHKAVSIHTLRHSYATHLLEAGVSLRLIQQYLGHSSLQTTTVYLHLTSQGQEQARAAIDKLMQSPCPPSPMSCGGMAENISNGSAPTCPPSTKRSCAPSWLAAPASWERCSTPAPRAATRTPWAAPAATGTARVANRARPRTGSRFKWLACCRALISW